MPARDSFGDATNHSEGDTVKEDTSSEAASGGVDESIHVTRAGELADPAIEADPEDDPEEYLIEAAELSVADPVAAGEEIGTLLSFVRREEGDRREDASLILERLGDVRPREFEVWIDALRALAESPDREVAFVGLRSFAQLAAESPEKAKAGLSAGLSTLGSGETPLCRAALALVAEIGASDPEAVRSADGAVATALREEEPTVRVAGAIAAGRLLAADPSLFPRTAAALPEALADDHDRVRQYAHVALANFAREHPESVPEKGRAIEALAAVTDRELGLREGETDEALSALLPFVEIG